MSLRDRVAVVVGGGTGIGRATAMPFAAEGARITVSGGASRDQAVNPLRKFEVSSTP